LVLGQALFGLSQLIAGGLLGQYFVMVGHCDRKKQLAVLRGQIGLEMSLVEKNSESSSISPKVIHSPKRNLRGAEVGLNVL
jgi:hypothetical protein